MGITANTNAIVLKMQGGTTSGEHICPSCSHCYKRRGVSGSQDLQICTWLSNHARSAVITGPIAECSSFYPKNLPQLHELKAIAWDITTIRDGSKRKIGFISPQERRAAAGNQPATPWEDD